MVMMGGALSGCAGGPTSLATLHEARVTLDRARSADAPEVRTPEEEARIREAEGALHYAEGEFKLAPDHPLSEERAENALEKARAALAVTVASRSTQPTAH